MYLLFLASVLIFCKYCRFSVLCNSFYPVILARTLGINRVNCCCPTPTWVLSHIQLHPPRQSTLRRFHDVINDHCQFQFQSQADMDLLDICQKLFCIYLILFWNNHTDLCPVSFWISQAGGKNILLSFNMFLQSIFIHFY